MNATLDPAAAAEYAAKHGLQALVVERAGTIVAAHYGKGFDGATPHALYSGTKSFWGVAALYAQEDGLLTPDELVCDTIASWQDDPWKRRVTLRMLLTLTAGFGFGGLGSAVPNYAKALGLELKSEPGTTFAYGGIQLQVFGAVFARKLEPHGETPQAYLRRRVLDPAGISIAAWRSLPDGTQPLPTGASLGAEQWLAYGRFVLANRSRFAACFEGTKANPRYGLGWWLSLKDTPKDLFYASGSGGQGLYVVPSLETIAVHFGNGNSYKHEALLKRLFP